MRNYTKERAKEVAYLADDARALLEATAHVAGHKVDRARKRVALALEHGKTAGEDLIDASADMAADNIKELRDRIAVALGHGKEFYDDVHDDVVSRTKAADHAVREYPYQVMGLSLGVGALAGFIFSHRHSHNGH